MSETTTRVLDPDERQRDPGAGLPRLLAGVSADGAMTLGEHVRVHGELPASGRRERRGAGELMAQIEQSGLTGRGGAAFPMGAKLRAVTARRGRPIVVVNATEGEPASLKDRTLLETLPHLMLDGAALTARAIGAEEVLVCVCESAGASLERVERAISERARGRRNDWPALTLVAAPEGYIVGHESALVRHLNGGPAKPTFAPPLPFEAGVRRQPTLVNNAETFAHVALIARHGPRWFRRLGMPSQPGSTLVTLSGPVAYPGVYEVEYGASLSSLLDAAGGTTARVRAALFGGYAGTWLDGRALSGVALSDEHLAPHYATMGAGVIVLLSSDACPVAETARVTRWLARQSARQCGPCIHGLDALADTLGQVASGAADRSFARRTEQLVGLVQRRGACSHPDGTARFVMSALEVFSQELADHAQHGTCEACLRPAELPLPVRARSAVAA